MWKITNISNERIKVALAKNNTTTIGVILDPNQFCVCDSRMTSSLDAQSKRKFLEIETEYSNTLNLELCLAYDISSYSGIDEARKQAEEYKG